MFALPSSQHSNPRETINEVEASEITFALPTKDNCNHQDLLYQEKESTNHKEKALIVNNKCLIF